MQKKVREKISISDPAAMKVLMDYDWPGNVRELENVIERAVVLSPGNCISADLFPKNITMPPSGNSRSALLRTALL